MAVGKLLHGVCYTSDEAVAAAIASQYPQQQGVDVMYLKAPPTWDAAGVFTYAVWSGTNQTQDQISITAPVCDTNSVPSDPLFTVVMFAACAVMFGLGFIGTR